MEWISVSDRLPSKEECSVYSGWFLVKQSYLNRPCLSRYDGHEEGHCYEHGWKMSVDDITHWINLPEIPKAR